MHAAITQPRVTEPTYVAGFRSLGELPAPCELRVEGEVPSWLDGGLLKTGPGTFELGATPLAHHFDGPALLQRYDIAHGEVRWHARWLDSALARDSAAAGRLAHPTFGTGVGLEARSRIESEVLGGATPSVNGNVAFADIGGSLCAVTDGSQFAARVNPQTLESLGVLRFDDALTDATASGRAAQGLRRATTAHYQRDPADGSLYNYFAQFGPEPGYSFFRIRDGTSVREPLGELATDAPAFVHAFSLTEQFLVFPEFPLVCDQEKLAAGEPFGASLVWRNDRATRIHVLRREDASCVRRFELEPCYVMHAVNAFERAGEIVWDVAAYADGDHVRELYLDPARRPAGGDFAQARAAELRSRARLVRIRLPLAGGGASVEPLSGRSIEFPVLPDRALEGRPYRRLFSGGFAGNGPGDRYYNQIVRFDLERGSDTTWHEPGHYAGEPVFVPRPGGAPDEGVVLAAALDGVRERAYLAVLDGATLALRARAWLPFALPFSFHGCFVPRG